MACDFDGYQEAGTRIEKKADGILGCCNLQFAETGIF